MFCTPVAAVFNYLSPSIIKSAGHHHILLFKPHVMCADCYVFENFFKET